VVWLWGGGLLLVLGSVLAAVPGTRRRPTDPVSAPVPALQTGDGSTGSGDALVPASAVVDSERPGVGAEAGNGEPDREEQVQEPVPAGSP
jgi:hypothetical protein